MQTGTKKSILSILLAVWTAALLVSCQSGDQTTQPLDAETLTPSSTASPSLTPDVRQTRVSGIKLTRTAQSYIQETREAREIKTPSVTPIILTPSPAATRSYSESIKTLDDPDTALSEEGPWLILSNQSSLYAFNPDGSGRTLLIDSGVEDYAPSPTGPEIAYITDLKPDLEVDGYQLRLYNISTRQDRALTDLQEPGYNQTEDDEYHWTSFEAMRAIRFGSPAWSHNGKYLAFIGQQEGPSADLYVYALQNDTITRLSAGPSQAYAPSWSPNDLYIFHAGAWNFGTGAGYNPSGSWVARRDGGSMIETTLIEPNQYGDPDWDIGSDINFSWTNDGKLVLGSWSQPCGWGFLQIVDFFSGTRIDLWPYYFEDVAYDPQSREILITVPEDFDWCFHNDQPTGVYLFKEPYLEPELIPDIEAEIVSLDPSTPAAFLIHGEETVYRLLPDNQLQELEHDPSPRWAYSGQAGLWLWYESYGDDKGLWIGDYNDPPEKIFSWGVFEALWSPDGEKIYFISGRDDALYQYDISKEKLYLVASFPDMAGISLTWMGEETIP